MNPGKFPPQLSSQPRLHGIMHSTFAAAVRSAAYSGSLAEWFKALVLKTSDGQPSVSSNLTASAIHASNLALNLTGCSSAANPSPCTPNRSCLASFKLRLRHLGLVEPDTAPWFCIKQALCRSRPTLCRSTCKHARCSACPDMPTFTSKSGSAGPIFRRTVHRSWAYTRQLLLCLLRQIKYKISGEQTCSHYVVSSQHPSVCRC